MLAMGWLNQPPKDVTDNPLQDLKNKLNLACILSITDALKDYTMAIIMENK